MTMTLVLATGSQTRQTLLRNAGVSFEICPARINEENLRQALMAEGASAADIAVALAEKKAGKIATRFPEDVVLGCDQVLECGSTLLSKPETLDEAKDQLCILRGRTHRLLSAAVIHHAGRPVWRHVSTVRLTMRRFSDDYLDGYLRRNRDWILQSVGGYRIEEEGLRLFSSIEGDYFTVLGLPLLEILAYLGQRGVIEA